MARMKTHNTQQLCPRCAITVLVHVHCAFGACPYVLHVCYACDRSQAVHAMMDDHQKDCVHQPVAAVRNAVA